MTNRELETRYKQMKLTWKNLVVANIDLVDENKMLKEENERLNNIINELDKQNGELGADLSIKDRVIKTNWWLENMLKQATNRETKAIINGALDLLLGSDKE